MYRLVSGNSTICSVDMMFAYLLDFTHPIESLHIEDLDIFTKKVWVDSKNRKYAPIDVFDEPRRYAADLERIMQADLQYPIIYNENRGVLDGIHRICKAHLLGYETIDAYVFDDELVERFIIAPDTKAAYKEIENTPLYELMSLYRRNFPKSGR